MNELQVCPPARVQRQIGSDKVEVVGNSISTGSWKLGRAVLPTDMLLADGIGNWKRGSYLQIALVRSQDETLLHHLEDLAFDCYKLVPEYKVYRATAIVADDISLLLRGAKRRLSAYICESS